MDNTASIESVLLISIDNKNDIIHSVNYWLGHQTTNIIINLGCDMAVTNVILVNTNHAHWGGFAGKKFKISIRSWENHHVWNLLYEGSLRDQTGKVTLVFFLTFQYYKDFLKQCEAQPEKFDVSHIEIEKRIGKFVSIIMIYERKSKAI